MEREEIDSGRALDWGSRHPEMQLKVLTSTRSALSPALFLSGVVSLLKYQRYEKRKSNIPAHVSSCIRVKEGDHVIIGQCRSLSKTFRFNVLKVIPAESSILVVQRRLS
ncbi:hypothetical protein QYF36_002801 [Acer negundo]|nr:hypothetical protein QYF36_002801 [Acer negundo]